MTTPTSWRSLPNQLHRGQTPVALLRYEEKILRRTLAQPSIIVHPFATLGSARPSLVYRLSMYPLSLKSDRNRDSHLFDVDSRGTRSPNGEEHEGRVARNMIL